ncbi:unnamed protein product [Moneuplotes crassus]|uniref:Uncharacterized protein n=1 Tax=Euplotes crassus TaxID=5936 RepID=A0AAD1X692_EUPCR|nr:unnamed protein product [Moneuplotes crassus]
MAFVFRSERETLASKSNPSLGPGSYIGVSSKQAKPSNAPFNATSKRKTMESSSYNPGPGTYSNSNHLNAGFDRIQQESVSFKQQKEMGVDQINVQGIKQTSNFASKVPRFNGKNKENLNLGPGRYVPEDTWIKQVKPVPKAHFQPIQWERPPNAPSIPSHENVFGYEETKAGVLKKQKNPEKVTTGVKEDRVGPGQYELPNGISTNKKGAIQWKKAQTKRFKTKKSKQIEAVGPGHYQVEKSDIFPIYKYKQSSVFASRVERATSVQIKKRKRGNLVVGHSRPITAYQHLTKPKVGHFEEDLSSDEDDKRGPGCYINHENLSSFNQNIAPRRKQFFGSTVARFEGEGKKKSKVGPGSYNYEVPGTAKTRASTHYQSRRPPFSSSGNRFGKKTAGEEPGPGSYSVGERQLGVEQKRMIPFTKSKAFGTTEKRFVSSKSVTTPGPGQYKPENNIKLLDKKKGGAGNKKSSSIFLSSVPRNPYNQKKKKTKEPSVGTYEVKQHTIEENIKKKAGVGFENPLLANLKAKTKVNIPFSSQSKRFTSKVNETDAWLAPGYYEYKATFDESKPKTSKAKDQNFLISSSRFDGPKAIENPGPGHYGNEEGSQWYKRSFNMIFTE